MALASVDEQLAGRPLPGFFDDGLLPPHLAKFYIDAYVAAKPPAPHALVGQAESAIGRLLRLCQRSLDEATLLHGARALGRYIPRESSDEVDIRRALLESAARAWLCPQTKDAIAHDWWSTGNIGKAFRDGQDDSNLTEAFESFTRAGSVPSELLRRVLLRKLTADPARVLKGAGGELQCLKFMLHLMDDRNRGYLSPPGMASLSEGLSDAFVALSNRPGSDLSQSVVQAMVFKVSGVPARYVPASFQTVYQRFGLEDILPALIQRIGDWQASIEQIKPGGWVAAQGFCDTVNAIARELAAAQRRALGPRSAVTAAHMLPAAEAIDGMGKLTVARDKAMAWARLHAHLRADHRSEPRGLYRDGLLHADMAATHIDAVVNAEGTRALTSDALAELAGTVGALVGLCQARVTKDLLLHAVKALGRLDLQRCSVTDIVAAIARITTGSRLCLRPLAGATTDRIEHGFWTLRTGEELLEAFWLEQAIVKEVQVTHSPHR